MGFNRMFAVLVVLFALGCKAKEAPKAEPGPSAHQAAPTPVASETAPAPDMNFSTIDGLHKLIAFKNMDFVRRLMGEPEGVYEQKDRVSWYYTRELKDTFEQTVCPEIQFMEDEMRFLMGYSLETMRDKMATARLHNGVESAPVAREKRFPVDDFMKMAAVGQSKTQIRASAGEPDSKRVMKGFEVWQYDNAAETADALYTFAIRFEGENAVEVNNMGSMKALTPTPAPTPTP